MAVEVLEEGVNLSEAGKDVFVGSEAALLDDPVVALTVLQNSETVCFGNLGSRAGELPKALDLVVFAFFKGCLAVGVVDVTRRGFLRLCVFPFGSVYITLNACNSKSFLQYKPKYSTQIFGLGIVYFMPLRRG